MYTITIFSCFVVEFQINTKVVLRLKKTERNLGSATMSTSVFGAGGTFWVVPHIPSKK